ncbi:MAG: hypothetical protein EB051_04855 [Chlamydiia bacterium]|nr:hypothetical protein [Chlamydiia bacterium]
MLTPVALTNLTIQPSNYCTYNSQTNQVFFSYQNSNPYFSVYNCNNGTIAPARQMNNQAVGSIVYSCYNSQQNQIFFSWDDQGTTNYQAIYDCTLGTLVVTPTPRPTVQHSTTCTYASLNNEVFFGMDFANVPNYKIYQGNNGGTVTNPQPIPNATTNSDVFSCYNSRENQVVFSWQDNVTKYPYFAIYNESFPQVDVNKLLRATGYSSFSFMKGNSNPSQ